VDRYKFMCDDDIAVCDVISGVVLRHWLPECHVVIDWQCG